jgi:hypothetical protein
MGVAACDAMIDLRNVIAQPDLRRETAGKTCAWDTCSLRGGLTVVDVPDTVQFHWG